MPSRRALLIAAVSLSGLGCQERVESQYATAAAARAAGAVERGWLPTWLPPDAREIREVHDIDTNVVFATFRQAGALPGTVPDACKPIAWAHVPLPDARPAWWPAALPPRQTGATSALAYQCGLAFMAISGDSTIVYYWRTAG